jgi:hypothetical protein
MYKVIILFFISFNLAYGDVDQEVRKLKDVERGYVNKLTDLIILNDDEDFLTRLRNDYIREFSETFSAIDLQQTKSKSSYLDNEISKANRKIYNKIVNESLDEVEKKLHDKFATNLSMNYQLGEDDSTSLEIIAVQPIKQFANHYYFFQGSIVYNKYKQKYGLAPDQQDVFDDRGTFNAGLIYRYSDAENYIFGVNSFYDYVLNFGHKRFSVGAELVYKNLDITANRYYKITKLKSYNAQEEEVVDGYDLEILGALPYMHWLNIGYHLESWDYGAYDDATEGLMLKAEILPSLFATYYANYFTNTANYRKKDNSTLKLSYIYQFGKKIDSSKDTMLTGAFPNKEKINKKFIKKRLVAPVRRKNEVITKGSYFVVIIGG